MLQRRDSSCGCKYLRQEASVAKSGQTSSASVEYITRSILVLRGQRVLLDVELADLYGVATKALLN
jgi:hypothetical protein